ncbi:hypothetical protein M8J77_026442 [Diaphorina citri]|nr:hypothetical protein M8J77_026442 [Diaphorina citri]
MAEEEKDALKEKANSAFKENLIRLVTVFAYASSVSMAALVLSSYYVFFWEPKPPGPGPPVIHPHAYVSEPYPPLKLVAPPPHGQDTEGASFWESVWSYIKPGEESRTTIRPPIVTYITTRRYQSTLAPNDSNPDLTNGNQTNYNQSNTDITVQDTGDPGTQSRDEGTKSGINPSTDSMDSGKMDERVKRGAEYTIKSGLNPSTESTGKMDERIKRGAEYVIPYEEHPGYGSGTLPYREKNRGANKNRIPYAREKRESSNETTSSVEGIRTDVTRGHAGNAKGYLGTIPPKQKDNVENITGGNTTDNREYVTTEVAELETKETTDTVTIGKLKTRDITEAATVGKITIKDDTEMDTVGEFTKETHTEAPIRAEPLVSANQSETPVDNQQRVSTDGVTPGQTERNLELTSAKTPAESQLPEDHSVIRAESDTKDKDHSVKIIKSETKDTDYTSEIPDGMVSDHTDSDLLTGKLSTELSTHYEHERQLRPRKRFPGH